MTTSTLTPDNSNEPTLVIETDGQTGQTGPTEPITPLAPTAPAAHAPSAGYTAPAAAATTPVYPPARPTNVLGIITLVLGVLGFAIVPVITGHIALAQIKRTNEDGRGLTIAGLVLGYIGLAGYVLVALLFFGALFLGTVGAIAAGNAYDYSYSY